MSDNKTNIIIPDPPFILTNENYYSDEANRRYMSNSRFKDIYGHPGDPHPCQMKAIYGTKDDTEALLVGSYVDSWFEGPQAFDDFCKEHQEQIMQKSGKQPYKFIVTADNAIAKVKKDKTFMFYMSGDHQTIMTGEIAGQPFKIKMDSYKKGEMIVDLKYVKTAGTSWNDAFRRHVTFIESYGYIIQGAIYQEIEYQNSGTRLPFFIAYITKEDDPDFGVVRIPQVKLNEALEYVKLQLTAKPYQAILAKPKACGRRSCPYCRSTRKLSGYMSWTEFQSYALT